MEKTHFKLKELLKEVNEKRISLPTVQRGFVWKPSQIEDLWDSLLRQYPIGAFVVSEKNEIENGENIKKLELLDGQQRATSICLGLCSDKAKTEILKSSLDKIRIFIDLGKPNNDKYKYIFRVITKSHPWGYQRSENTKVLNSKQIREYLEGFRYKNKPFNLDKDPLEYLNIPLDNFAPYDAIMPVPLNIFIESNSVQECTIAYENWKNKVKFNGKKDIDEIDVYSIEEIYLAVKEMLKEQRIPLLNLKILDNYQSETEQQNDDVENLFIRLNANGTPLSAEELNYSILKSNISVDTQMLIETNCEGFIRPSRFITILYKLFEYRQEDVTEKIKLRVTPKQFQKEIRKNISEFEVFIKSFIENKNIEKLKEILLYSPQNTIGLSQYIVSDIADKSAEIMFILFYRLFIKGDYIDLNKKITTKILGVITIIFWLRNKKDKQAEILKRIAILLNSDCRDRFWSSETIERSFILNKEDDVLINIPCKKELSDIYNSEARIDMLSFNKIVSNTGDFEYFYEKMLFNRSLLFYAQREVIYNWFGKIELFDLEDTNVPYDFDHISPQNFIRKRNIRKELKSWYNTIGNLRVWPLALNRHDQDDSPSIKLSSKKLLNASFCDDKWKGIDTNDLSPKETKDSKEILNVIISRAINVIEEWYNCLKIDELIPVTKDLDDLFETVFKVNRLAGADSYNPYQIEYKFKVNNRCSLYFAYDPDMCFSESYIDFGIITSEENRIQAKKNAENYNDESLQGEDYIFYGNFTLQSSSDDSIRLLINDLIEWIKNVPKISYTQELLEVFNKSLKRGFKVSE